MNSPLNLTTASLRRMFLIAALVVCSIFLCGTGNAQTVTATLLNNGSSIVPITGQTFTLTLSITTNFVSSGITFFLGNPNGTAALPFFRIISRDMSLNPYPDPTTDDATAFTPPAGDLNPVNDFDLGSTNNGSQTDPAGTYTIAIFTLQVLAPLTPGQYPIFTDRGVVTDRTGGGFNDINFSTTATIIIPPVPEPATVGLAVIGGAMLLVVTWRKRARA